MSPIRFGSTQEKFSCAICRIHTKWSMEYTYYMTTKRETFFSKTNGIFWLNYCALIMLLSLLMLSKHLQNIFYFYIIWVTFDAAERMFEYIKIIWKYTRTNNSGQKWLWRHVWTPLAAVLSRSDQTNRLPSKQNTNSYKHARDVLIHIMSLYGD